MKLKHIFISAAALLPLTMGALAADLPSRKAPLIAPPPVFTWTGIYVGGEVGYQWSTSVGGTVYGLTPAAVVGVSPAYNSAGVVGGGHLGYNYQINQIVVGVEGDVEGSTFYGSGPYGSIAGGSAAYRFLTTKNVEGSARARIGYAWDKLLIYATGGGAFASVKDSYTNFVGTTGVDTYQGGRVGWTVGGGVEWFFRPNWSARVEYRYTDLGTYTDRLTYSSGGTLADQRHLTYNSAKFGVSYHFSMFAPPVPVVAKY